MILRYSFPQFESKILDGEKIHTFRTDEKKRWRAGMSIQHYMYSYMNPKSFKFLEGECQAVQEVRMMRVENGEHFIFHGTDGRQTNQRVEELFIFIDGHLYVDEECLLIMANDGLTKGQFIDFFLPKAVNGLGEARYWFDHSTTKFEHGTWNGRLIHWTEKLY